MNGTLFATPGALIRVLLDSRHAMQLATMLAVLTKRYMIV
jgi:hypothetical protein